ncbi:uncharacterized protein BDZ99DRAFT_566105 [Mytilinidion resinicola]|uniref:F-box domain-containing protein n=1 Tax=Mytilinidion resinicola TaxID=574789 RepID=A0A6A6Z558_9PEZI|nr:uncharacterized protein BDZ99DRAFT_566105 [Mytilinidion resinicola]KAF2816261.1 hypothetical protein BDZ99DRAFT_566105 [Mytilinidion resinicola]
MAPDDGHIPGLPQELWDIVVRGLSPQDIKSLRLTSKAFNYTTSPYLFTRVCLSSHPLDLDIFTRIAKHPAFHQNVQELIWDDSTFRPDIVRCRQRDKNGTSFWKPIAEKHLKIRELNWDKSALELALSRGRFPKLTKVTYALIAFRKDLIKIFDPKTTRFPTPTWRLWYEQYYSPVGEAFNPAPDFHVGSWPSDIDHRTFEAHRGLRILRGCFERSGRSVPTLSLDLGGYRHQGPTLFPTLFCVGDNKFHHLVDFGKHIRQFNIKFSNGQAVFKTQGRHLFYTLNTMQNLEKVTIETPWGDTTVPGLKDALLSDLRLPKLHAFALDGLELQHSDLLKFLALHKDTLGWLFLKNCTMSQSTEHSKVWASVTNHLRQKQFLYEACRFDECYEQCPIYSFDPFPLSRRRWARDNAGKYTTGPLEDFERWAFAENLQRYRTGGRGKDERYITGPEGA